MQCEFYDIGSNLHFYFIFRIPSLFSYVIIFYFNTIANINELIFSSFSYEYQCPTFYILYVICFIYCPYI